VIPTVTPPPAQIQVNTLRAEIASDRAIIAAQRAILDDPNASRRAKARATQVIASKETGLAEYQSELTAAQAQVAQQTVVPTAVRATPAAPPTPQPEPPTPSLIPPGYRGVITNNEGEVIGYTLPGGAIEWVPGSEPVEEEEPTPVSPSEAELQAREDARDAELARTLGPDPVSPSEAELQAREDARDAALAQAVGGQTAADREDADMGRAMNALGTALRGQATSRQREGQNYGYDWRVKLQLAPGATYLYKAQNPGILAPLAASNGVIFPYMPTIGTSYNAKYDSTELTHSNYRGYFYKNSAVENINIAGTFTAQNTAEALYLLAVIHFFRSATKMFYGQDRERGTPPPVVYLQGLGEYQFNNHPCLLSTFNYQLPNGVDYIRTQASNQNLALDRQRQNASQFSQLFAGTGLDTVSSRIGTLTNLLTGRPVGQGGGSASNNGDLGVSIVNNTSAATYVPTKMEINITLMPLLTRKQQSQQFSLKSFANGDLLKRGFW